MVWFGRVWYGMVWCGMVWCVMVGQSKAWCGYGLAWLSLVSYGVAWLGLIYYATLRVWLSFAQCLLNTLLYDWPNVLWPSVFYGGI